MIKPKSVNIKASTVVVVLRTSVETEVRFTVPGIAEARHNAKAICKKGIRKLADTVFISEKNSIREALEAAAAATFPPNMYSEVVTGSIAVINVFTETIASRT